MINSLKVKKYSLLIIALAIGLSLPISCSPTQYKLSVLTSPNDSGTITPSGGIYDEGTAVTIIAKPAPGYIFDHWGGDFTENTSSTTLHGHMESNKEVTAYFKVKYTSEQIDKFIDQLGSSDEVLRLDASTELSEIGNILNKEQVERIVNIMRTGEKSWETNSWRESHCTWHEYTSIKYYAAKVLFTMKSQYLTYNIVDEAEQTMDNAITKGKTTDPGWI